MTISVDLGVYSVSAVLTAVKKQQIHADWCVKEKREKTLLLSFSSMHTDELSEEQCVSRFLSQLTDEQIREKLEQDFRQVRDLLVSTALAPIAKA